MCKCDFYKRFVSDLEMESMKWKHFIYFKLQILKQLCTGIYIVSIYAYFEFQLLQTHTFIPWDFLSEFVKKMYLKVLQVRDVSKTHALPAHSYTCTVKVCCLYLQVPKHPALNSVLYLELNEQQLSSLYIWQILLDICWLCNLLELQLKNSMRSPGFLHNFKAPWSRTTQLSGWTNVTRLCAQLWGSLNHSHLFQRVYKFY